MAPFISPSSGFRFLAGLQSNFFARKTLWMPWLVCLLSLSHLQAATWFAHDASGNLTQVDSTPSAVPPAPRSQNLLAPPGATVWLNAAVYDASHPIQWTVDGAPIPNANAPVLVLQNVDSTYTGRYEAVSTSSSGPVTNAIIYFDLDADRDDLGDAWEVVHFSSPTNQIGFLDTDGDLVSNADEFAERTNPKDIRSHNPRLQTYAENGTIEITPLLPFYTTGQVVTLTAVPNPGQTFLAWFTQTDNSSSPSYNRVLYAETNPVSITLFSSLRAVAVMGLPVEQALDQSAPWSMKAPDPYSRLGSDGWFGQATTSHDGIDALQSSRKFKGSFLQVQNAMPLDGTVSFWWRLDSAPRDRVSFQVNSRRTFTISGDTNWNQITAFAPVGTNALKWEFRDLFSAYESPVTTAPTGSVWLDELVFEPYTNPALDRDNDSLPDLWEYRHFDSVEHGPAADPDSDRVNNGDELADGTIPSNATSVLPRLTVVTEFGTVTKSPDKPKYNYNETVILQAVPDPNNYFVVWQEALRGTNPSNSMRLLRSETVGALFGLPLPEVLDAPALTFLRGGHIGFYGQRKVSRDATGSAQSGPISFLQESWMETTVSGPGSMAFWWKASLLKNQGKAKVALNGVPEPIELTGVTDWALEVVDVPSGPQTIRWSVTNQNLSSILSNAAWIDLVQWTAGPTAPRILRISPDTNVLQGSNLVLTVRAAGTPALSYQWFHNGTSLGAAGNTRTLSYNNMQAGDAGQYVVQISNDYGQTSSPPITVSVLSVPPANNNFAQRSLLSGATPVTGHNTGATTESGEPSSFGGSVWYRWIAPASGRYRAIATTARPGGHSLEIDVYQGSTLASLRPVASDSEYSDLTNDLYEARADASFPASQGVEYVISVRGSPPGLFTLQVLPVAGPANDHFANRIHMDTPSVVTPGTTVDASVEPGEPVQESRPATATVWYSWTAASAGSARIEVSSPRFLPLLSVFTGSSLNSLTRVVDGEFSFESGDLSSVAEFNSMAGQTYQIQVGAGSGEGVFTLTVGAGAAGPRIASARVTGTPGGPPEAINFEIQADPGSTVIVEASSNLINWVVVRTETVPASGVVAFAEAIQQSNPQRFYRFKVQ